GAWLHVDASYGGGVLFSEERRALMHGSGQADSLSLNPHKLLGVPISCSVLLMRERGRLRAAHGMQADYLFHGDPEQTCDRGDLSLQCGRRADALKLWMAWQAHGDAGFGQRVDRLFALATAMRDRVRARAAFELVREPQGCNICFRMLPHSLRRAPASENRSAQLEVATLALRERLIREGRHMVNYAPVDGAVAFRWVANNPEVRASDLDRLLDDLERLGADL
ncbi:MAG TPA: pyridoxal-dependent decarboxylase, partial [Planctomycetota bacterium]